MHLRILLLLFTVLSSCAQREIRPQVRVLPNPSGLQCGNFEYSAAHSDVGGMVVEFSKDGRRSKLRKPVNDVPSGVWARVTRSNPIRVKGSRYMVSASGSLCVVTIDPAVWKMTETAAALKQALYSGSRWAILPRSYVEIPSMNAARCFVSKLRVLDFPWGRGLVFITTYVQGSTGAPVNNDMLVLVLQGLTTDGRFAVSGHFDIRHPRLPDTMDNVKASGRRVFDIDDRSALNKAETWLNRQSDDSFHPSIPRYVALFSALEIK